MNSQRLVRSIFGAVVSVVVILAAGNGARSQTKGPLVEGVEVIGYRRLAREEILSHIKTRPGEAYNEEAVERDLRSVLDLGQFDSLYSRVLSEPGTRGGVVLIFEVHELPLIESVKFYGLPDGVSESEIIQALSAERVNVVKGVGFDPVQTRKAKRIIAECLASHGWLESGVDVSYENITSQSVAITFEISLRF